MDNTEYLKQITDAEKKQKQIELEQAKSNALTSIGQEQAKIAPAYTAQRQSANVSSQLGAKNFAEFLANRQQTGAGISVQSELSRQNMLGNTLTGINTNENNANTEFANQKGLVETNYQNNLANTYNAADTNLQTNLYNEKLRVNDAAIVEAKYQEQLRQQTLRNQFDAQKYQDALKQQAFENNITNQKIALERSTIYNKTSKTKPNFGTIRNLEGKNQVWDGKTWKDIKYATQKNGTATVLTDAAKKQKKLNDEGYGLTTTLSGITYKEKGKEKQYATWQKDGISYVAINDTRIPLAITADKQNSMNIMLTRAMELKKITPAQREQLLNTIEVY